jgi:hypothetical protein
MAMEMNKGRHPSLRQVIVGFNPDAPAVIDTHTERPPLGTFFPRAECGGILDMIIRKCAVVEFVQIATLFPWSDEREIPRACNMVRRKDQYGKWVERQT